MVAGSPMAAFTNSTERLIARQIYVDYCTIVEIDKDGTPGVKCHSLDHPEYYNTVSLKVRSTKINNTDPNAIQHVNALVLQKFAGNCFGEPYTPRVGDLVAILFMYNQKPLVLGQVATIQQEPVMRASVSEDAKYDYVNKWCQWLRPKHDKHLDYFDHPKGKMPICFKRFHGPVTGSVGKGRDEMTVWDCQKGDSDPLCKFCSTIDSVPRSTEQWEKIYSKQTESTESYNSRMERHARCGSYLRFESDDENDAGTTSTEYSEGIGHIRLGNATDETHKKAHINFHPAGTVDIHSEHEEVSIENEVLGARTLVTGSTMSYTDDFGTIACESEYLPKKAISRIYRDGSIRHVANNNTENGSSALMLNVDGESYLWNLLQNTYIEFPAAGDCNVVADTITLDGDVVITGSITHGEDLSCQQGSAGAAILAGQAGGQTLNGGTAASENLTLDSTADATKGIVTLQPSTGCVSVGTTTNPAAKLCVNGGCNIGGNTDPGDNNLSVVGSCSAATLASTVTTGTAPLTVASTTLVQNLHAALADAATNATNASNASTLNNLSDTAFVKKTDFTAKGSIQVASAAGTPGNFAVGQDGQVPVAHASETQGVIWLNRASGLYYNAIVNPQFQVNQRGITTYTSSTVPANSDDTYLIDKVNLLSDGNNIVNVAQDTTNMPTSAPSCMSFAVVTANKKFGFALFMESKDALKFVGKSVSLQFKAKTATSHVINNMRAAVLSWSSTADTITSDVVNSWGNQGTNPTWATNWTAENTATNLALTTIYQTFKIENIVIDTANTANIAIVFWVDDTDCASGDLLYLGDLQLNEGPVCLPFTPQSYIESLIKCRRYLRCWGGSTYERIGNGACHSTTQAFVYVPFDVPMRTAPIIDVTSAANTFQIEPGSVVLNAVPTIDSGGTTANGINFYATTASGLTVGHVATLDAAATTSMYLRITSEL